MIGKNREYEILNRMIDDAIDGTFSEDRFDETQLSKLQTKLMRYLTSSSMSERKINEEKDNLKELITNISHQTKTPLTNIRMYSELLREEAAGDKEIEYAEEIVNQSRKLEELITALVKMSRLETGIFRYDRKTVPYSSIINRVLEQAMPRATEKDIRISVNIPRDLPICVDEKWVAEAVCNILDNGIKYSPAGTEILFEVFSYEMFSGIRITDRGIGIEEDELPLIFGRFYRGRNSGDEEGIGVGLFLAREIVRGNGGYIKAKSKINEGTAFEICFPNLTAV
ncbi:MAG: sensor histidine kinase [Lentihominibacter sp.]